MSKFFNYYTNKNHIYSIFHKIAIATTVMIPVFAVLFIGLNLFSSIASIVLVSIVSLVYLLSAIMAVAVLFDKSQLGSNAVPLIISTLSGPAYVGLLFLADPSFGSVFGTMLYILIPFVAIIAFFVDEAKRFQRAEDILEFEEENMPVEDTVEISPVSS